MVRSLTGTRIREFRRRKGVSQTALARQAGISTSYLNLIEHNKRGIAGKVLLAIARALDVAATELAEGADAALISTLQEAAAYRPEAGAETAGLAELAGRFPGWSKLLATLYRQSRDQEDAIAALSDRLTHDPFLAESLHLMLSNITAIRSTNGILASMDDIAPERRARFHAAIKTESRRLSDAATALLEYFDRSVEQGTRSATPEESVDRFLAAHACHFPALDQPDADESTVEVLAQTVEDRRARVLVQDILATYLDNARAMPLVEFTAAAAECAYDPAMLARKFGVSVHQVFLRLACLHREGSEAPAMGVVVVNAAGQALRRLALPDFPLPRHGNACALWPVFRGFSQPGRPLENTVEMPDGTRFVTLTLALPRGEVQFGDPPDYLSAMLVIPHRQALALMPWLSGERRVRRVGTSCRICARDACDARIEDSL